MRLSYLDSNYFWAIADFPGTTGLWFLGQGPVGAAGAAHLC